jgi:hypothetical protein
VVVAEALGFDITECRLNDRNEGDTVFAGSRRDRPLELA